MGSAATSNMKTAKDLEAEFPKGLVGGIEGGASKSTLMIFDAANMKMLVQVEGGATNVFSNEQQKVYDEILEIFQKAEKELNIKPGELKLKSLGLCLSGLETNEKRKEVVEAMKKLSPQPAETYAANSDTVGTLKTANEDGTGIVLIAGTGSNALLVNPNERDGNARHQCGGHGHMIGDEGSATGIVLKALRKMMEKLDQRPGSERTPNYDAAWAKVKEYYADIKTKKDDKIDNFRHIYSRLYKNFNKTQFAGLCKEFADIARNTGDPFCVLLFKEAGAELADHVLALQGRAAEELLRRQDGGLPVVTVGSVWKSWDLLREGFEERMRWYKAAYPPPKCQLTQVHLMELRVPVPYGACIYGMQTNEIEIPDAKDSTVATLHSEIFKKFATIDLTN